MLGVTDPVLPELLPVSRDVMVASYPEIHDQWPRVSDLAYNEETSFRRTLTDGSKLFDLAVAQVRQRQDQVLPGDQAFQLHDTYGFPIDLTLEMAAEQGITVDQSQFHRLMAEQKARAKADAQRRKGQMTSTEAYATLRRVGETHFIGYTDLESETTVLGLIKNGVLVETATPGDEVEVVLAQTPFYAEAGGQDADSGRISSSDGSVVDVVDVQKPVAGLIVHRGIVVDGQLRVGQVVQATVDAAARFGASQAHSATHVVHAVLRRLLGPTATQAGSYNKPGYLRFDFSATSGLSDDLKAEVEGQSNEAIRDELPVTTRELPLTEAQALGAMAMFGEKYGSVVRMVEIGGPWSRELCGGTHVAQSGQIGLLTLLGEQSVGSGVRRVEALVSADAFDHLAAERAIVAQLTELLKVQPDQLPERIGKLLTQLKQAEKTITDLTVQQAAAEAKRLLTQAVTVGDLTYLGVVVNHSGNELRSLATELRGQLGNTAAVVALIGVAGDKPTIVVATTEAARAQGHSAGALIGPAAAILGGRGGGKADLAQGGGTKPAAAQAALDTIATSLATS
jgi:alanyl-tRNA synthetase